MRYFLAIDLGTTGCRGMVFDENLRLLGASYEEYGLIAPRADWYEQDATLWWTLACRTMKSALVRAGVNGRQISAVSASSQGISIVPVDRNFQPLRNAISWMDARAVEEERELTAMLGQRETFTRTGKRISTAYSLPKMRWIQKHEPNVWSKADKLLMPLDFLTAKLSGKAVTDPSMASGTLLYDIRAEMWDAQTLYRCGIQPSMLPEVQPCGTAVGTILPEAAKAIGLSPDCMVCVGAQDQRCAALGAGLAPGVMTVSLGTAAAVCKLWDRCETEGNMEAGWSPYIFRNTWVTEGVAAAAGASLRWLRDTFYHGQGYDVINAEAAAAQARGGRMLFLPYLCGPGFPRFDPASTGCFYGVSLASGRGDFALAVMEGVAFQIREILERMDRTGETKQLVLFGGGANSLLWRQIFADATGLRIAVPATTETAGVGAALLAGLGVGAFDPENLPCLPHAAVCVPSERTAEYKQAYERFCRLERRLESTGGETV